MGFLINIVELGRNGEVHLARTSVEGRDRSGVEAIKNIFWGRGFFMHDGYQVAGAD
jgi:hypothetical protein